MAITNLNPVEARHIVRKRGCSGCWEVLQEHYDEHTRTSCVSCSTPDCPCRGHVSVRYAENALAESRLKRAEAERALGECGAVPWIPKPVRRTEAAILTNLAINRLEKKGGITCPIKTERPL